MAARLFTKSLRNLNTVVRMATARPSSLLATKSSRLSLIDTKPFSITVNAMQQQTNNVLNDLASFLSQEIKLEKDAHKSKANITGFVTKTEGPNVTLTKSFNNESITVKFSVNSSLDNSEPDIDAAIENESKDNKEQDPSQMKSRPAFTVDLKKDGQTLSFWCSFIPTEGEVGSDGASEDFQIDEFAIHDGEWNENIYSADCAVLDGQLYDILLNLLEERGIGEKFANELAEFSTSHEHKQYIDLLEKLNKFAK